MSSPNLPKITIFFAATIISLLSACGGGGGGTGGGSFTASSNTNTKPQTSSSDNIVISSEASSSSPALSSSPTLSSSPSFSSAAPLNPSSSSQTSVTSSNSSSLTSKSSSRSSTKSNSSSSKLAIDTVAPSITPEVTLIFTEYDLAVFSWVAATDNVGVTTYKIYRNQIQIDQIDAIDLTYADFNVAPNNTYTYGVSAGDAAGNWSAVKTIIAKTQPIPTPPSSASSSSKSLSSGSSTPSNSSKSSALSTSSASSSSKSASTASSLSSSPDTTPPSAPGSISQLLVSSSRVDIGWTAATDNVGVTTYRVYRDSTLLGTTGTATLEYSDKTTVPNKLYTYSVESGDAAGNWSLTRKTIFITTPAASTKGDVTLYWAPPTQREDGSSITNAELGGFLIRYKSLTDTDYTFIDINDSSAKSRIISNLVGDYVFQIAAYDSNNLYSTFVALTPK